MELTNGVSSQTNTLVQIPEIKHEPINHIRGTNEDNIESKNGKRDPIYVKMEPHDSTSETNVNCLSNNVKIEQKECPNDTITVSISKKQTSDGNKSPTLTVEPNQPVTNTGTEKLDLSIESSSNTRIPKTTQCSISPEIRPSQGSQVTTPKKRRKNLNY